MNVVGAPKRILFTLPAADVVGSTAVYLAIQPPTGSAFDVLAVYESVAAGINTYHADITSVQTTAGGIGIWRVMPKLTGADAAIFPKYDDAATLDFELQWDTGFNSATLITPTQLREHVTSALSDLALQQIIDAEESEIIARYGAIGAQVEEFSDSTPGSLLFPSRIVSTVTSITEKYVDSFIGGYSSVTLATSDYEIVPGGRQIRRLMSGTNPCASWGRQVTVTYVPADETARRVKALIDLCKLSMSSSPGLKSESVGGGEYSYTAGDVDAEREKILARLGSTQRRIA